MSTRGGISCRLHFPCPEPAMKPMRATLILVSLLAILLVGRLRAAESGQLMTGADQTDKYVPYLKGKRVGLVGNPSSIIGDKPSVDVLPALAVHLVKLFGPEHGFRGNASNGTSVGDEIDPKSGLPIISLYGKKNKPSAEDLADVDEMIYDIQSVGVRFYTNINVLRNVMQACADHDKELLI